MIKSLVLMLQFLTRLPVHMQVDFDRKVIARGTLFFPFIGMLIGAIAAGVYYLLHYISVDVAALGAVFTIIAVTGGIHLDGLSDTADGFFSSRTRERVLEIMKDSRVGTFGVIAIIFNILSKYVFIKNMDIHIAIAALILSCGLGRLAETLLFSFGKSARPGGMGDLFLNNHTRGYFAAAAILFMIAGFFIGKFHFLIAMVAVLLFSLLFMRYAYRVIGGLTGDVFGAVCELSEMLGLLVFLVVQKWI